MLNKFKVLPLKVKLSVAFILALFVLLSVLIPPLAITIVLSLGLFASVHTILTYLDRL